MPLKNTLPTALLLLGASTFTANAQTPFTAGTNVAIAKPGTNSAAKVYTIYTKAVASSPTYTAGVTFTPAYNLNGIGLNSTDNLVYGTGFTGNSNNVGTAFNISLFRIGANGVIVDLGLLPLSGAAGSGALEFVNFSAGTVSVDDKFYYMTYAILPLSNARIANRLANGLQPDLTAADLKMYVCWKSAISTLPANPGGTIAAVSGFYEIDFSNADITAGINAFLTQVNTSYPNVYDADGGIQDFAFNPIDSKIYGYISYPSGPALVGRPVVLSAPVGGIAVATPVGSTVNTAPGQEAAGVQFDITGNFYALFTTGGFTQVNLTTGALVGITASNISISGGNLRGDLGSTIAVTPLYLDLVSFSGRNNGNTNELKWITATEQNTAGFAIERSEDQREWLTIGFEATKATDGNSNEKLSYSFTDKAPNAGLEYYRLRETTHDGKVSYSTVIALTMASDKAIDVYPNPASDNVHITGLTAGDMLRVLDISGKIILTQTASGNSAAINLSKLPANLYMVQVLSKGSVVYTTKLTKK
jgi:hypothetical protein